VVLRGHSAILILLHAFAFSPTLAAEGSPFPLEPPDTSSPRATIESFLFNNMKGASALRNGENAETIISWFARARGCLDLSEVSRERTRVAGTEAGLLIYEVLSRVGLPDLAEIPGEMEAEKRDLQAWTVPQTTIVIVRVKEGDRAGEYLFSQGTVARALDDCKKVKHLPRKPEFAPGTYEIYVTAPNLTVPFLWADALPSWAKARFLRNATWK
jgi:MscS family membrane protein